MTVAIRAITRLQDADDFGSTPGAGNSGYAITWDNDAGEFVLSSNFARTNAENTFTANQRINGYKLVIGNNDPSADDSVLLFTRAISGANPSAHSIRDESTFTASNTGSYATIDAATTMSGSIAFDHIASFQSRQTFNGSLSLTNSWGYRYQLFHTGAGAVTYATGVYVLNASVTGGGSITRQTALWCEDLTSGSQNFCIYSPGATQSYHAGYFQFGANIQVATEAQIGTLAVGGGGTSSEKFKVTCYTDGTLPNAANVIMDTTGAVTTQVLQFVGTASNNGATSGNQIFQGINGFTIVSATSANCFMRYTYGGYFRVGFIAYPGYTSSSIGGYALQAETPLITGSGTIALAEIVGLNVANQGTSAAPSSYGVRVENQSGSTNTYAIETNNGLVVFNQGGDASSDVRIEGDTDANLLFTDASADTVQIGAATTADSAKFYVAGKISASGEVEINGDLNHDGSNVGFYATAPAAKQTVSGSRASNAALASLLTALATIGLITDSSTES